MTEHKIQVKVVQYFRTFYPDLIICSIPNGSGTTAANRLHLYNEGLLPGMPDLFVAYANHGFFGMFVELKTTIGVESPDQKAIRKRLNNKGYLVYVANSAELAIELIENYLAKNTKLCEKVVKYEK